MALRCQPGDLAVVIEGSATGSFVTVLTRGEDHPLHGWPSWHCRVMAPTEVTLIGYAPNGRTRKLAEKIMPAGGTVLFCDKELKPIRPPPKATPAPPREVEMTA
jgi:hypothetical protein